MVELKRKRNFHTTVDEQSFDLEQGDPCAAAEGRLKRGITPCFVICCCILFLLVAVVFVLLAIFFVPFIHDKFWRQQDDGAAATAEQARWTDAATSRQAETTHGDAGMPSASTAHSTTAVRKSTTPPPITKQPAMTSGAPPLTQLPGDLSTPASASTKAAVTKATTAQTSGSTTLHPTKKASATGVPSLLPGDQSTVHCGDYYRAGHTTSTIYKLRLPGIDDFHAYCEMVDGDGWMVLQRRTGPEPPFWDATFDEYASGFGNVAGDHWLGLERVHALGRDHSLQLRIIVSGDFCESKDYCSGQGTEGRWQGDWNFKISDRTDGYRMEELSYLAGTLSHPHNDFFSASALGQRFTTIDEDNDLSLGVNCAEQKRRGGWWHGACSASFGYLNGQYDGGGEMGHHQFWMLWTPKRDGSAFHRIKPMSSVMMVRAAEEG